MGIEIARTDLMKPRALVSLEQFKICEMRLPCKICLSKLQYKVISPSLNVLCHLGSTCEKNEFICNDGTCIDLDLRCNGRFECFDKSDELNCQGKILKLRHLFVASFKLASN